MKILIPVVVTVMLAAACFGQAPEKFDVMIDAESFDRGTVMAVEKTGWADAGGIIQCADNSPDWAEWDFEVQQGGAYRLHCKFAAQVSRPVDVFVDDRLVRRGGCSETTGGWRSSTAQWFPVGILALEAGKHTLRILRATCIPHIDAFGMVRDPEVDLSQGALALPEELWLDDGYAIQDWMIWTIGGTEQFGVRDGSFHIRNGKHTLNRPLYATNGPDTVFAGDLPVVMLHRGPTTKLGALAGRIITDEGEKWLHESETVDFTYDGAHVGWTVRDPAIGESEIDVSVVALEDSEGFMLRASSTTPTRVSWWFGGLRGDFPENRAGVGPMPGGRSEADCKGNSVRVGDGTVEIQNDSVEGARVFAGTVPAGAWGKAGVDEGEAAQIEMALVPTPAYLVVATDRAVLDAMLADPAGAFGRALDHYDTIAGRLSVSAPDPIVGAAIRGNNASLDGQWRPPSFLHGALRWGSECDGWYLGWRGWYGPIVAGDFERVQEAARFHFDRQFSGPATGTTSVGKVASFVTTGGTPTKAGYNMQEVFLDHLKQYYWWTGDHELMRELWPKIKLALAYERREMGKGLEGLYTNAVNTWISDGHHYNGNACTQASAYAVAHNDWAAGIAQMVGDDAGFYRGQSDLTRRLMQERLWIKDRGYFAEYVDSDGALHDAAEAPSVYHPIEFGATDAFQSYQMTRFVDERLWRFGDQILANDWFPVIVTNGLIGFNESLNTALAYYHAGRFERAWRLLKVCCESTAKATVPGSISCYGARDGAQGTYVDFTDASSMLARTVVEGLFGLQPRVDQSRVEWQPRFPAEWNQAQMKARGFSLSFEGNEGLAAYTLETEDSLDHQLRLPVKWARLQSVSVNGKPVAEPRVTSGVMRPYVEINVPSAKRTVVELRGAGTLPKVQYPERIAAGDVLQMVCADGQTGELRDPQGFLEDASGGEENRGWMVSKDDGHHTAFVNVTCPAGSYWAPVDVECVPTLQVLEARIAAVPGVKGLGLQVVARNNTTEGINGPAWISIGGERIEIAAELPPGVDVTLRVPLESTDGLLPGHNQAVLRIGELEALSSVRLWRMHEAAPQVGNARDVRWATLDFERNDTLSEIFTREYEEPNEPRLNSWTWYETNYINTDAMRERATDGVLTTHVGIPFGVSTEGKDGMYLSRWNPFPEAATVHVGTRTDRLYLLLANHNHNSQTHMVQAKVKLVYADGTETTVPLKGPGDIDGMLQHYSDMAPEWIGGRDQGWYGHGRASGVHADITDVKVDGRRELARFELRCVTEETLIGLLGATVHLAE